ncbi:MAG: hypothetical protein V4673_14195 [Pseudomonadota bacterium]
MLDRHVCQTEPQPESGDGIGPFSVHIAKRNIILLGDPGAGKTELFKQAAAATDGEFLTVRRFLNTPIERLPHDKALWIDALDETRSGRGDQNTVDRVVAKLETLQPVAVRLSCRAADWLGKSDLAAFEGYFEHNGGAPIVVQLQPLSEVEQQDILSRKEVEDPATFLAEARRRGLDAMLTNPQTLLMLAKAVRGQQWPATRSELFEQAAAILLQEHNDEHGERGTGQYTAHELLTAAGALCALRLVSDFEGFCLRSNSDDDEVPSYRVIDLAPPEILRSTLTRRVFVSTGTPDVVDYAHRTLAEYLGARWLAERIRQGLPLGRVRSLLGVDGCPASGMRGLHAWLATLSTESASVLIGADPLGVLMYGDCMSMPTTDRLRLLDALGELSERDGWFYMDHRHSATFSGLIGPDMVERFQRLLGDRSGSFSLRLLVLDAMLESEFLPGMHNFFCEILNSSNEPYALRERSLELLSKTDNGRLAILEAYDGFGGGEDGLRLRAEAIQMMYGNGIRKDHFSRFLHDVLSSNHKISIGKFYGLEDAVPTEEIVDILDLFDFLSIPDEKYDGEHFDNQRKDAIAYLFQGLIVRYLVESSDIDGGYVLKLLSKRLEFSGGYEMVDGLIMAIKSLDELPKKIAASWVSASSADESWKVGIFDLRRATLGVVDDEILMGVLCGALGQHSIEKETAIYESLLGIVFNHGPRFYHLFEQLHTYADGKSELIAVRQKCCSNSVDNWLTEDTQQQKERAAKQNQEKAQKIIERYSRFDEDEEAIASGEHLGWLGEIGEVYFRHRSHGTAPLPIEQRLPDWFGPERALIALEGMMALVARRKISTLAEMIAMHADGKYWPYWLAVIAGLDVASRGDMNLDEFSDEYISSAIGITCYCSFYQHVGNSAREWDHAWLEKAIRQRPELAVDTYVKIVTGGLTVDEQHPRGLYKLQNNAFAGAYRLAKVCEMLSEFPDMREDSLRPLLAIAKEAGPNEKFKSLVDHAINVCLQSPHRKDNALLWLAFGFMIDMPQYAEKIKALDARSAKKMVWALLDSGNLNRSQGSGLSGYDIAQLEFVARYASIHYPYTSHPTGSSTGRHNDWDASSAIIGIISTLSSQPSDEARASLRRLCDYPEMHSYADHAKHSLVQQHARMVDAGYRNPRWREAVLTLSNKAPASIQDLQAYVLDQLADICQLIANGNTDPYKQFWNTVQHDKIDSPKSEELARDTLIELLRPRLHSMGLRVEPEGHMARDKRADIVVFSPRLKCVIELKRDYHKEVWAAATTQLERLYTRDPEASGYGIYGVFWYGEKRKNKIPRPPSGCLRPDTSLDMQRILESTLPEHLQHKIKVVVFDVSGEILSE